MDFCGINTETWNEPLMSHQEFLAPLGKHLQEADDDLTVTFDSTKNANEQLSFCFCRTTDWVPSANRTRPNGPNPALRKGPDPSLLITDYITPKGPNKANYTGPQVISFKSPPILSSSLQATRLSRNLSASTRTPTSPSHRKQCHRPKNALTSFGKTRPV